MGVLNDIWVEIDGQEEKTLSKGNGDADCGVAKHAATLD